MTEKNLAAIDLGTNSCRLLISDQIGKTLYRTAVSTRMGEKMSAHNRFTDAAVMRGLECMEAFAQKINEYHVEKYRAIATAACRMAENGSEFVSRIKQQTGIELEIIDGYEEARLNLLGAITNVKDTHAEYVVVYDLGGGSTEITLATKENHPQILHTISIPFGARNGAEKFELGDYDKTKASQLAAQISIYCHNFIKDSNFEKYRDKACCVATSSTPLRLAHFAKGWDSYERERADGVVIKSDEFDHAIKKIQSMTAAERMNNNCIGASRADIFNAACVIFSQIYRDLGIKEITTSFKSAVDGMIMELQNDTK